MLPPTVLFLTDHGICGDPPPRAVTLPRTVVPLTSAAIGFQAQTLPLMVMVECPSGSSLHGWAELPLTLRFRWSGASNDGGRYWDRTSDLFRVRDESSPLYRAIPRFVVVRATT